MPAAASRRDIDVAGGAPGIYPGTCRDRGLPLETPGAALRVRVGHEPITVVDRALGTLTQDLAHSVGDFVIRRADGLWAYQLAVVVDDADQGITDVVRGADLWDNTPRQRWLQQLLGLPQPRTLHVAVRHQRGRREAVEADRCAGTRPRRSARGALVTWTHLGFAPLAATTIAGFLAAASAAWGQRWARVSGLAAASR